MSGRLQTQPDDVGRDAGAGDPAPATVSTTLFHVVLLPQARTACGGRRAVPLDELAQQAVGLLERLGRVAYPLAYMEEGARRLRVHMTEAYYLEGRAQLRGALAVFGPDELSSTRVLADRDPAVTDPSRSLAESEVQNAIREVEQRLAALPARPATT